VLTWEIHLVGHLPIGLVQTNRARATQVKGSHSLGNGSLDTLTQSIVFGELFGHLQLASGLDEKTVIAFSQQQTVFLKNLSPFLLLLHQIFNHSLYTVLRVKKVL
jgi:hypothetical protein